MSIGSGLACLVAAGLSAGELAAPAVAPAAAGVDRAVDHGAVNRVFAPEAAPRLGAQDAVNLASAPAYADPVGFDRKAMAQAKATRLAAHAKSWRQVGPRGALLNDPRYATDEGRVPTTGIVLSIATDPRSKSGAIAYLGTGGGLFKTTNNGRSWTRAQAIPAVPVAAVAVDARRPANVYAVTGQGFQGGGEFGGVGAYYSHDSGKTWHAAKNSVHGAGQQVVVGPDGAVFAATTGGLFRSTDHGVHYSNVLLPTNAAGTGPAKNTPVGSWTSDVQIRPTTNNGAYTVDAAVGYVAGNVPITQPDGKTVPAAPGNGLYISTRNGKVGSFKRQDVSSPVTGWKQPYGHISNDPIGRTRLAWTADGKWLFALVADAGHRSGGFLGPADPYDPLGVPHPTSLNGVYRSGDGGRTWSEIATSESLTASPGSTQAALSGLSALGYNTGIQAWYNGWIAVDPTNQRLLIGEEEVYQSDASAILAPPVNAGAQPLGFESIDAYVSGCGIVATGVVPPGACPDPAPSYGGQVTHPDQHGVAVVNQGGGAARVWIGNDGGIFRQDHGNGSVFRNGAWTSAAHLNELLPYRAQEGSNGEFVLGLQDNGTSLYPPKSSNSYEICGGDGTWVAIDKNNPSVFWCNENGDTVVTTDGGKTTTDITPCLQQINCITPVFEPGGSAMDPFDSNHVVIATSSIYETTKGAATNSGNGTTDTGDWKDVYDLPTTKDGTARSVEALDVEGKYMYAGACGVCQSSVKLPLKAIDNSLFTNVKKGCKAAESTSNCWHQAKLIGMPKREIYGVAMDPRNVNTVYLATIVPSVIRVDFGGAKAPRVLMSTDRGDHVRDMSGNLPRGNVWDIKLVGNHVYAATDYGVFVAKVGSKSWRRLGRGMPVTRVFGLNVSTNRKDLVAATYGAGAWVYPLRSTGVSTTLPKQPGTRGSTVPGIGGSGWTRWPGDLAATLGHALGAALARTGAAGALALAGLVLVGIGTLSRRRTLAGSPA